MKYQNRKVSLSTLEQFKRILHKIYAVWENVKRMETGGILHWKYHIWASLWEQALLCLTIFEWWNLTQHHVTVMNQHPSHPSWEHTLNENWHLSTSCLSDQSSSDHSSFSGLIKKTHTCSALSRASFRPASPTRTTLVSTLGIISVSWTAAKAGESTQTYTGNTLIFRVYISSTRLQEQCHYQYYSQGGGDWCIKLGKLST